MNKQIIDRDRPEGAYVSWEIYPPSGGMYSTTLFTIERVNGDCSVDSVGLTIAEAKEVIGKLTEGLQTI